MRTLSSLLLALAGAALLIVGAVAPLTPSEGLPPVKDMAIYGVLPLIMIAAGISLSQSAPLRLLLSVVFLAGVALLGYVALALLA